MDNLKFEDVYQINVNDRTKEKNGLTYLSWARAWGEFKKLYPTAEYKVKRFDGNLPYVYDEKTGYMVFTEVAVDGLTYEMWLPVMGNNNKALQVATMTDINKAIMRCLTKNLAVFGLGLYIYEGEDLPDGYKEPLDEALVDEFTELGGTLEVAATYFKTTVDELTNEHLQVLIDRKKKALKKAGNA